MAQIDKHTIDKIATRLDSYSEESRTITSLDGSTDVQHKISFRLRDDSAKELRIGLISIALILSAATVWVKLSESPPTSNNTYTTTQN